MKDPILPVHVSLPPLPYSYSALEPVIDREIMELHHTKHHAAYVQNFNAALEQCQKAKTEEDLERLLGLEPILRFHGGGHFNHSLFWQTLAPIAEGGGQMPDGLLLEEIKSSFGGFEAFRAAFTESSLALQGSGWVWLAYKPKEHRLVLTFSNNQDSVASQGLIALFGLDLWEHAYYLQYKNLRAGYVAAMWQIVNWSFVQKRLEKILARDRKPL